MLMKSRKTVFCVAGVLLAAAIAFIAIPTTITKIKERV